MPAKGEERPNFISILWQKYCEKIFLLNDTALHIKKHKEELPAILIIAAIISGIMLAIITSFIVVIIILFLLYYVPGVIVDQIRRKRALKIEAQLVPALVLVSNSLRAGLDIIQGFELVVRDMEAPMKEEFEIVLKEYNLGTSFEEALIHMRSKLNSKMINTFVTSIIIQRESGGDITKIMSQIIDTIREANKLQTKLKTLTTQGRMQAIVILALPWAMGVFLLIIQPSLMLPLFTTTIGIIMLSVMAFLQFIGMLVIKKIVTIET
ncbi:MAG: type II secretion system F family protein [Elusimicrobiota bacterium]